MSRTNTAAYESIKASQIVFQNPDRSFPEPGAVLSIDNLRGATSWTRNLDIDSVALAGPSSVGTLTYNNQLLVNGIPVGGGGGADVSGGSNIAVDLSGGVQVVSLDIQEDIDMHSNSIFNCKTIELPRIPNTSSAKITFGSMTDNKYGIVSYEDSVNTLLITSDTNVDVIGSNGKLIVGAMGISGESYNGKSITNIVKSNYSTKVSSLELNAANTLIVGATDISSASPTIAFQTDVSRGTIAFDESGIMRLTAGAYALNAVSSGSFSNVLGYDVATGAVRYQPAAGGSSDLSGGYNIAVGSGAINMNITQPVLMNNNPIVNASYVDLSSNGSSERISYTTADNTFISTANMTIKGPINPRVFLFNTNTPNYGTIQYENNLEKCSINGPNVALISDYGSQEITSGGPTMTSYNNRIYWNVYDPPNLTLKSSLTLTTNNELTVGNVDVSANPVINFQGGKAAQSNLDTKAKIEYFDASGVEQLRLTSKNYALNAVPAAGVSLPTVLGYDTTTGEIKVQPATNGISALSNYTYDASGTSLSISGSSSLVPFIPNTSGVYSITFSIGLSNSASTAIEFNNTFEAFRLSITPGFAYPNIRVSGIQNRVNAGAGTPTTDIYGTTIMEMLTAGVEYSIQASHEVTSPSSMSKWASCIPRVRIAKLC